MSDHTYAFVILGSANQWLQLVASVLLFVCVYIQLRTRYRAKQATHALDRWMSENKEWMEKGKAK